MAELAPEASYDGGRLVRTLADFRAAGGSDVAFGGPVTPGGGALDILGLHSTNTRSLQGLRVRAGCGLGGKALVLGRPVSVNRLPRRPRHHPPVRRPGARRAAADRDRAADHGGPGAAAGGLPRPPHAGRARRRLVRRLPPPSCAASSARSPSRTRSAAGSPPPTPPRRPR
ncbi:hypothetical protein G5V59_25140 [Nocardioides sp. W3-2-3]|uniref:hypothetical protein n=1 Tax=Nocardioides convexus TaxID=2712224 RepID=UPI0024186077|nr:hypothetical protein [Nocardioides convexus]NHA01834.1 hypothetical protein [Nocardioides convexus]